MNETITLRPGEMYKLKLGLMRGAKLMYCGMPSKESFSIACFTSEGYQGYGLNIYYPKDTKTILISDVEFRIISVTPEQLSLQEYQSIQSM